MFYRKEHGLFGKRDQFQILALPLFNDFLMEQTVILLAQRRGLTKKSEEWPDVRDDL